MVETNVVTNNWYRLNYSIPHLNLKSFVLVQAESDAEAMRKGYEKVDSEEAYHCVVDQLVKL